MNASGAIANAPLTLPIALRSVWAATAGNERPAVNSRALVVASARVAASESTSFVPRETPNELVKPLKAPRAFERALDRIASLPEALAPAHVRVRAETLLRILALVSSDSQVDAFTALPHLGLTADGDIGLELESGPTTLLAILLPEQGWYISVVRDDLATDGTVLEFLQDYAAAMVVARLLPETTA